MSKILKIDSCFECPCCIDEGYTYSCFRVEGSCTEYGRYGTEYIPDWCPLPSDSEAQK